MPTKFRVTYRSIDHYTKSASFASLAGAQRFAQKWVGPTPEVSRMFQYAISGDGIGKVTVSGCDIYDLFPALAADQYAQ